MVKSRILLRTEHGLTLMEVMIALTLFCVGILAVASMQSVAMDGISTAQRGIVNLTAAGKQIEELLLASFDDVLLSDPDDGFSIDSPDHGPFAMAGGRSAIEWEVQDNFPVPGTKRIRVMVRSPAKLGAMSQFTYEYVKSKDFK